MPKIIIAGIERNVKVIIVIGLDDTDNSSSRGTGRLARQIAGMLGEEFQILGVTRHQLLLDPRIPYTAKNSSAAISLRADISIDMNGLFERVKKMILDDFQAGSDPGLCMASRVPSAISEFGKRAQREVLTQKEASSLAGKEGVVIAGLGGTNDGIIGALAAVGLAACGEDGRYLTFGNIRNLSGLQPIEAVIKAGIVSVQTMDGNPVKSGFILADKLRPARRGGVPVQYVRWQENYWAPVRLD
jgi:hypothetical protein